MKQRKIYISGPITGLPYNEVLKSFNDTEDMLIPLWDVVINPTKISPLDPSKLWIDYMRTDIAELIKCDAIYMMFGWKYSKGARLEKYIAEELGLKIFYDI